MSALSQVFPPTPRFTEANLGNLAGKVYIITGATAGVGLELAKILYSKDATVYMGARSSSRAQGAIDIIKNSFPMSRGILQTFVADLGHLVTVKPAVEGFLERESRLDVLFLNAGVMTPPAGSKTGDGYDMELGTNCLGPHLLTRLLEPILKTTAKSPNTPPGSVRIVWVSSFVTVQTPKGGLRFDARGNPMQLSGMENYMQSKVGTVFQAAEFANRLKDSNITSVSLCPGLMRTELQRHKPAAQRIVMGLIMKGPKFGAYTEIYAGLSPEVTLQDSGSFYIPWGRRGALNQPLKEGLIAKDGKESLSGRFYGWCEGEIERYLL